MIQVLFWYKSLISRNNFEAYLFHDTGQSHDVIDKPHLFHDTGRFLIRVSI